MKVVKRSGQEVDLDKSKIMEVVEMCCEGLENVSASTVVMNAKLQFFDGITTVAIHDALIRSAHDMVSELQPDYQYVAGRLLLMKVRKEAYGTFETPSLSDHIEEMCNIGMYHPEIKEKWSQRDIEYFDRRIDQEADFNYTYGAMVQWKEKYLVQNRVTKDVYESPQIATMVMAMCFFQDYPKSTRKQYVIRLYNAIKDMKISLPSPIMGGLRTPTKQYSSCTLIEIGDSLSSINAGVNAIVNYSSKRAGIGLNAGRIRSLQSPIRGGEAFHTGAVGFFKLFEAAMGSCSQGSLRKGSATLFYPFWHKDFDSFIVLKNNKGTESNRVRHIDYGVQLNRLFYQKALNKEHINLFCPNDVPELYEAFFKSNEEFEELYNKYSEDSSINKKTVSAFDMLIAIVQERASTGRIYIQNVDHCNEQGPFISSVAPIKQSNLC